MYKFSIITCEHLLPYYRQYKRLNGEDEQTDFVDFVLESMSNDYIPGRVPTVYDLQVDLLTLVELISFIRKENKE